MLQLSIILLMFSLARESPNVSSMVTSKVSDKNARTNESQPRVGVDSGDDGTAWIDILSKKPEFEASGQKDNVKRTSQTLEQFYGRIGRWLSSKSGKKKQLKKEQRCCVCCGKPISDKDLKTHGHLDKGSGKCSVAIEAKGRDGCKIVDSDGAEILVSTAGNSKLSLQRSSKCGPGATGGFAPQSGSNVVFSSVQRYDGLPEQERKSSRRPVRHVHSDGHTCICQFCCAEFCPESLYDCCGTCIIFTCGGLLWSIDRGCRAYFGLVCKGLGKCLNPCCG